MGSGPRAQKPGRYGKSSAKKRKEIMEDQTLDEQTKTELIGAFAGKKIIDPRTGLERRFTTKQSKTLLGVARAGADPVFRERQRLGQTKTLLTDRPGRGGLLG